MRVQLASDLHLEFLAAAGFPRKRLIAPAHGADILVLAGDICTGALAIELFADWPVPVLYVAGNHEFYGHDFHRLRRQLKDGAVGTSVTVLDNDCVELGGVRFLGSTLWTDYQFSAGLEQWQAMARARRTLADHSRIRSGAEPFGPEHALAEHNASRRWLEQELSRRYDGRTVVVTHHAPHPGSVHARYAGDPVNCAFVSDLGGLVGMANLWLHGHVHDGFDYVAHGCRVVANPLGYPRDSRAASAPTELRFENAQFKWACVLNV